MAPTDSSSETTWQGDANHETEGLAKSFLAAFFPQVAIVLLVGAVKLQQLHIVVLKAVLAIVTKHFVDRSTQQLAGGFGFFDF